MFWRIFQQYRTGTLGPYINAIFYVMQALIFRNTYRNQ
jgi:hypothetical protein